jgi:heme exporter protein A
MYNRTTMISVELEGLAKAFNRRPVFTDVSVTVESGHALAVAGPNGSGKSTLLRLVCGLLRPSSGHVVITIDGQQVTPQAARNHLGLVAPDVALYGELTALENMAFFARVRGLAVDRAGFTALLERLGLAGRGNDEARTYSSGMRHRLKYACALLHRPDILLLDEPTNNLDEDGTAVVRQLMAEQKRRGILIIASNDPDEVAVGDQVVRLGQARRAQTQ